MNDCCYVCSDSRESMDPFDQYPDMGSYRTIGFWSRGLSRVWVCDVCTEDNEKEGA